jgi:hypothetical protein
MTRTFTNDDGVLVVEAGPVVLESVSDTAEPQEEEAEDDLRPGTGE